MEFFILQTFWINESVNEGGGDLFHSCPGEVGEKVFWFLCFLVCLHAYEIGSFLAPEIALWKIKVV